MKTSHLKRQLLLTLFLVWLQRAVRLLIRAAWTGAAGYLVGWGLHSLWGWLPDPRIWLVGGSALGAFSLVGVFLPWPRLSRLAWALDRRLGLREQASTAWQVAQAEATGQVAGLLVEDAVTFLPRVRARIARRGWFLARDLEASVIVALLLGAVFWGSVPSLSRVRETRGALLPPLGEDPSASEVFPSGIPGLESATTPDSQAGGQGEGEPGEQPGGGEVDPSHLRAVASALSKMGESLSQQAVTYELGQALQQEDLEGAAQALENLADQLDSLSDATQEQLAEAMQSGSNRLEEIDEQPLSEDLQAAADALRGEDSAAAGEQMDELASSLRTLAQQAGGLGDDSLSGKGNEADQEQAEGSGSGAGAGAGAGLGTGERETGEAEPLPRLQGEGEILELSDSELDSGEDQSGLLRPGTPSDEGGMFTARGTHDVVEAGDASLISSVLTPYHYSWRWRDVVSAYFSP